MTSRPFAMVAKPSPLAKLKRYGCYSLIAVVVLTVFTVMIDRSSKGPHPATPPVPPQWFEGGTLHKATAKQWLRGSDRNRLATAADLTASMLRGKHVDMDELRRRAEALKTCLDEATTVAPADSPSGVPTFALACWVLLGYER